MHYYPIKNLSLCGRFIQDKYFMAIIIYFPFLNGLLCGWHIAYRSDIYMKIKKLNRRVYPFLWKNLIRKFYFGHRLMFKKYRKLCAFNQVAVSCLTGHWIIIMHQFNRYTSFKVKHLSRNFLFLKRWKLRFSRP